MGCKRHPLELSGQYLGMKVNYTFMSKTAYLFPGQGSQAIGMGRSFHDNFDSAKAIFRSANDILGFDLKTLCFEGPEDTLKQTENAQVALYVTSVAGWKCLQERKPEIPQVCAGHSVGEYAALTAAGMLPFEAGLKLVRKRGELMRDAAARTPGTMAALLGIEADAARQSCDEARAAGVGVVCVANYNGGRQVVISGELAAVEKACEIARTKGAKRVIPLSVTGAFHSPLMVTAGDALYASISETGFVKSELAVILNVTADYVHKLDDLTSGLTMQVSRSVLWEQSMHRLLADGIENFVEIGSGDVLTGLMKRIQKGVHAVSITDLDSLNSYLARAQETDLAV